MILNYPSAALPNATYTINSYCDSSESYRTNPIITGEWFTGTSYSGKKTGLITSFLPPSDPTGRFGWYLHTESPTGRQSIISSGTNGCGVYYSENGSTPQTTGELPQGLYTYDYELYFDNAVFETNIPIFDTSAHLEAYVTARTDAEALEILEQYAENYKKDICYISCVALPQPPAPEWEFEYTNLSIYQASDYVVTDINWNIASSAPNNIRYKNWILEFKVVQGATDSYNCLLARGNTDTGEFFIDSSGILKLYYSSSINISNSSVIDGSKITIKFISGGTNPQYGTLYVYKNDVLDRQNNTLYIGYDSTDLTITPLQIGAYNSSGGDLFNGTFEYIRFRTLN